MTLSGANCRPGDVILVSGTLGDHGIAIMSQREGLAFSSTIESDAAPLNHLIADVLAAAPDTHCFRDPTRGGLASTLNEFAQTSGVAMEVDEDADARAPDVQAACEMLGYDVLQVANDGPRWLPSCRAEQADAALSAMRAAATARMPPSSVACCHLPRAPVPPCAYAPAGARPASSTCSWENSCRGFANDKGSGLLKIFRFQTCPARMPSIMGCVLQLKRQEHPWQQLFPM